MVRVMLSKQFHVDDSVEVKFKVLREAEGPQGKYVTKLKEFNYKQFGVDWAPYFKSVPYFSINPKDYYMAKRVINSWLDETFPDENEIVLAADMKRKLPTLLKPHWDIMVEANQNDHCICQVLNKPIPGFEDLFIQFFSGHIAQTPYTIDLKREYMVLTVKGKSKDIDRFIAPYRL